MMKPEEEIANVFLLELVGLVRHIANIAHEESKIGNGIFILNVIDSRPECIMKDIVEALEIGASTATRQLDALVRQELIVREPSESDRRKVTLKLTEKGNQIYRRFKSHLNQVMKQSLQSFSKEEISQAINVFHTIVEHSENNLPLK